MKLQIPHFLQKSNLLHFPVPLSSVEWEWWWHPSHKYCPFGNRWGVLHMVLWDLMNHYISNNEHSPGTQSTLHWHWRLTVPSTVCGLNIPRHPSSLCFLRMVTWPPSLTALAFADSVGRAEKEHRVGRDQPVRNSHCTYVERMDRALILSSSAQEWGRICIEY